MEARQHGPLLKVEELASALNVPVSWVYKKAEQGSLPCIRVGRYLRFDLATVLASFEAHQ
jgi:excisionase family DNA binding protein